MNERTTLRENFEAAASSPAGSALRQEVSRRLAAALGGLGQTLWVGGCLLGPDRAAGRSPFAFGSDATVGFATVVQIGGQLMAGVITLLKENNVYAAAALVRQLVEVEYLTWAFAEDHGEAAAWLRSTRSERFNLWQPRHLRERSRGRFRAADYGSHCDRGGHPTPDAIRLLPDHSSREPSSWWWFDLAAHGVSIWGYVERALPELGWAELASSLERDDGLRELIDRWRRDDPLRGFVAQFAAG